jgi:serine protease Do
LITAQHVIQGASEVNVYQLNADLSAGSGYEARVKWSDDQKDIAALSIRSKGTCSALVREAGDVRLMQPVYAFLNAPQVHGMVLMGTVGSVWHTELGKTIVCDIRVFPGQSGSPLLDTDGKVLGMIVSRIQSNEAYGAYAVPIGVIEAESSSRRRLHSIDKRGAQKTTFRPTARADQLLEGSFLK